MPLYNSDVYISIVTPNISLAHPSYSNFGQTNDQRSSRRNGIFFFRPIQREEVSSLAPAGFAVIRHPPLRACSCPQRRPPRTAKLRGPAPTRPQAASPIFRAALVQTSASLRPFHSALLRYKGGDTPQLALATPRLRQVAFGIWLKCRRHKTKTRSNDHDDQKATTQDSRPSPYPAFTSPPPTHAAPLMNRSWPSLPKVFVARDSSSPSPFGPTVKAMRSSQERGASVPPTLPRWTRYPSASCNSPTSKPLNGS